MDGLLGLIIALVVFAGFIFLVSRKAVFIMIFGACVVAVAILAYVGVVG